MNVLFIVTWYTAKDAPVLREGVFHHELALALKKECNVALYFPFDTTIETPVASAQERGLTVYRSRYEKNLLKRFRNWKLALKQIHAEFKPDVIHAHVAMGAGVTALMAKKKYGIPYVVTEHCPIEQAKLTNPKVHLLDSLVFRNSSANFFVSDALKEAFQPFFPKLKFMTMYNGVQNPADMMAREQGDAASYRRPDAVNASIVSAFYDKDIKGYQYLLPAVKAVVKKGQPFVLHVCGGGMFLEYYKDMTRELGIADSVIFYDQCAKEKVYDIVSQTDFLISASLFESAGVTVEEALMLGKPVLVTKAGGTNSLVTPDVSIVVEKGSTQALEDGITRMIAELPRFSKDAITSYAEARFDMKVVSKQCIKWYSELV